MDAVSILALGRVFVANMTGNIVFVGFALAGAAGFSLAASLSGLVGFLVGARFGGRFIQRFGGDRAVLLAAASGVELALVSTGLFLAAATGSVPSPVGRVIIAGVLAVGTGLQNAVVRRLAVPDMTTTVLTMTHRATWSTPRDRSWRPSVSVSSTSEPGSKPAGSSSWSTRG